MQARDGRGISTQGRELCYEPAKVLSVCCTFHLTCALISRFYINLFMKRKEGLCVYPDLISPGRGMKNISFNYIRTIHELNIGIKVR